MLRELGRLYGETGREAEGVALLHEAAHTFAGLGARGEAEATVREVSDLLALKQYDKAFTRIASDRSLLARTLTAGVRTGPAGRV